MGKPHKHAALIKAWADGATIQFRRTDSKWRNCVKNIPAWDKAPDAEYRVKPETLKYRVALFKEAIGYWSDTTAYEETATEWEGLRTFVRWLTDWIEVEI